MGRYNINSMTPYVVGTIDVEVPKPKAKTTEIKKDGYTESKEQPQTVHGDVNKLSEAPR